MFENREKARDELRRTPFEPERVATLTRTFPYFAKLSDADQKELLGHAQVLLAEKAFEGCGGLALTDDIKVTIAAQASLLLLHRDTDYFPTLDVILVYPEAYVAGESVRLGESHRRGVVVLSWDAIEKGKSVVLHELAHQLDQDGTAHDTALDKVLIAELGRLRDDVDRGIEPVLDPYGIKNVAELFAVATEAFFDKPVELAERNPDLYAELERFYAQDPIERLGVKRPAPPARPQSDTPKRSIDHCDLSNEPRAASLVRISDAARAAVYALGCSRCGYLGTLHRIGGADIASLRFVSEVLRCPAPHVVGALSVVGGYGDDVAFWSVLENGTIITTESIARPTLTMRLHNLVGHHPRDHYVVTIVRGPPARVYEAHERLVKKIARREGTQALVADPFALYVALRRRSADRLLIGRRRIEPVRNEVRLVVFAVVMIALLGAVLAVVPLRWIGEHLTTVILGALFGAISVTQAVTIPLAEVLRIHERRADPIAPAELFERARLDPSIAPRFFAGSERPAA